MRKLSDNAMRTRDILSRERTLISEDCEKVIVRDLEKILSGYFKLRGGVSFKLERGETIRISVTAEAEEIKPFGIVR